MDAFELLKKDHEKVSDLFSKIESAAGQEKLRLFGQLKVELDLHAHIEETVLYPALENTEEAREITLEAYEEHNVVKDLLAQLSSEANPDDEWDAKLKVLKENVEHHVEEEEGEMFAKARKALGQPEIEELGTELEAEKNRSSGGEQRSATSVSRPEGQEVKNESPGVLQRLATLVGLGGEPASISKSGSRNSGSQRTTTASRSKPRKLSQPTAKKTASKNSGAKKAAPQKETPKKSAARKATVSVKSEKAAPKAAARKATKARGAKKATKANRAGAGKRSSGSRSTATKSARRAASNKRLKSSKSKQNGKSTKLKSRSR